jgi:hypothetical protein
MREPGHRFEAMVDERTVDPRLRSNLYQRNYLAEAIRLAAVTVSDGHWNSSPNEEGRRTQVGCTCSSDFPEEHAGRQPKVHEDRR